MSDKLVSLAYTPAELKAQRTRNKACGPIDGQSKYPYGFSLRLDNDIIKKLGFDFDTKIGGKVSFRCSAEVTDKSERETTSGTKRNIELQITAVAFDETRKRPDIKPKTGAPSYPREAKSYVG
jgi:hypothetical protein